MFRCHTTTRVGSAPRRPTRVLVALILSAGVIAATPGAAQARTVTDADDVKDMAKLVDPAEGKFEDAPSYRINDIKSTQLTHTSRKVEVEMALARLKKTGSLIWYWTIVPKGEGAREVELQASEGDWSGTLKVRDADTGESYDCGQHDIDYVDDVVRMKLPRDCVGNGRWVQFRVGAVSENGAATYGDDALRDRPLKDSDNNWALSGRVYR